MQIAIDVLGAGAVILLVRKLTRKASASSSTKTSGAFSHASPPYVPTSLDCHDEEARLEAAQVCRDALWEDPMFDYFMPLASTSDRKQRLGRVFELFMWAVGTSF